jgi:hypothetical protein
MAEQYFINSTDLSTLLTIQRVDAHAHAPAMLQQDYLVPGRTGAVAVQPWFGPSTIMIGGIVQGATRPVYLDRIASFVSLCVNSGLPFTMKRVLPRASGTRTSTCQARYVGGLDFIEQISNRAARVMAEFSLLSSFWSDENYTSVQPQSSNFTLSVPGDTATSELIVTLAGGTSQRLTNTTTGDFIEFDASTSATPAVLNIAQFTALQGTTNVIDKVAYRPISTTKYWLTLRPGNNVMTLTGGGTAAIQYKGLFL